MWWTCKKSSNRWKSGSCYFVTRQYFWILAFAGMTCTSFFWLLARASNLGPDHWTTVLLVWSMTILYNALLGVAALIIIPYFFFKMIFTGKYRKSMGAKFGFISSDVFEGMRAVVSTGTLSINSLVFAFLLNIFYLALSVWFFYRMFARVKRKGLMLKLGWY